MAIPTAQTPDRSHTITILGYEGLHLFEFSCAFEIFGADRLDMRDRWYDFRVCAIDRPRIRAQGGLSLAGDRDLSLIREADTVLIPGWPIDRVLPGEVREALVDAHRNGSRLASICSGAFALAQTSLLDGKQATTHWVYAELLATRFPEIEVARDKLYVDEGQLITSAGSAAGIDMMLELVRRDHGSDLCNRMARRLVMQPHRAGGQRQFVERPVPKVTDARFRETVDWIRANANRDLSTQAMADRAAMSPRTFYRRFRAQVGTTPQLFLLHERIAAARLQLESSEAPLIEVAEQCGFGSLDNLRHHFSRLVGQSPAEYRRRFSHA